MNRRVTVYLSRDERELLEEIKMLTDAPTISTVVQDALRRAAPIIRAQNQAKHYQDMGRIRDATKKLVRGRSGYFSFLPEGYGEKAGDAKSVPPLPDGSCARARQDPGGSDRSR